MAEKEERILIKKQINYHPPYGGWCGDGEEIVFTRQEAIEKMAKGIVSILAVQPGTEPDPWEMWKDYAEAALNALLDTNLK